MSTYSASSRTIHLWAIGAMAEYMLFVAFNALIQPIFTIEFKLSPVWVGWALMLPRITDAILDPLLGHLSDNAHTKWGRRRPFLLATAILGSIVLTGMWWASPEWSSLAKFLYLLCASILLYFCFGTFSMTHAALGYELSDDYHVRTKVVAVRGFYFSLAALGGGWMYWLALREVFGGAITGIRFVAAGAAAVILVTGLVPVIACRERFANANRQHPNLLTAIRTTLRVRPFVVVLLLRFAQTLGLSLYGAMAFYVGVYSVFGGDKNHFAYLIGGFGGVAGVICSFALMPLSSMISRRLGKRRGLILCFGILFIAAIAKPLFLTPKAPILMLLEVLLLLPVNQVVTMFLAAIMPDICDIDELETGHRREGLFSAVMSFVSKIENSLCLLIGGYLVSLSGFNAELAQQPAEVLQKLRLFAFTPLMIFAGVAFAIAFFIPITEELMREVRRRLDSRHSAAAQTPAAPAAAHT